MQPLTKREDYMTGRAEERLKCNADRLCARVRGVKVGN